MSTFSAGGGSVLSIVRYGRNEMTEHEHPIDANANDIWPGMLIERINDGGDINVQPHATTVDVDYGDALLVAIEADERGMQADLEGGDQDPYSVGDDELVHYVRATGGGVYLLVATGTDLSAQAEADISAGQKLVSAGGATEGCVKQFDDGTDDPDAIIAEAEESVDNSGASSGVSNAAFIKATPA